MASQDIPELPGGSSLEPAFGAEFRGIPEPTMKRGKRNEPFTRVVATTAKIGNGTRSTRTHVLGFLATMFRTLLHVMALSLYAELARDGRASVSNPARS